MSDLGGFPWVEGLEKWRREVMAELAALPETLRVFREGIDNFQRITKRLLDATESIEEFTQLYAGAIADGRRRIEEAGRALLEQATAGATGPTDPVRNAVGEVAKAFSVMAELSPLWPRGTGSGPGPGSEPGTAATPPPRKPAPRRKSPPG
jgi:hypothetical protein